MKQITYGKHPKDYIISLYYWAKRLDAEEMIVHKDGTVTLTCKDGYICENYRPSRYELYRR